MCIIDHNNTMAMVYHISFVIVQIISVLYPELTALVDKLVDMFHSVDADLR